MSHLATLLALWKDVDREVANQEGVALDGSSLTMAQVVAIARRNVKVSMTKSDAVMQSMQKSIETLESHLARYDVIYGVNTACGGNADARTRSYERLQSSFFQHHQSGILPETLTASCSSSSHNSGWSHSFPEEVLRAIVTIRCNSLLRGHSAIRPELLQTLLEAVSNGIVPLIPQRGSISASGDLGSLAYLGRYLEGNSDTYLLVRREGKENAIVPASEASKLLNHQPIKLRPKEGLAIMNGTSASTALASLVLYDANKLAIVCQVITALTSEALVGRASNYDDFISQVRAHTGQGQVAKNLSEFLVGSKLCTKDNTDTLAQDRYALRTAPQWIGPQLEDLMAANQQIQTELNSTTDNPLVDAAGDSLHHGGNFQAASVTSAMEKTRTAVVMLGRLLMAQSGEMVNPDLNKGLPPNLCADEPSLSFTCKGVDVNMTAYYSELAFLANSVASNVQTAEMGNQSVNSLALISARMTETAVTILSMMAAGALFIACQALDLRARNSDFLHKMKIAFSREFESSFESCWSRDDLLHILEVVWQALVESWTKSNRLDLHERCNKVAVDSTASLLDAAESSSITDGLSLELIRTWKTNLCAVLESSYKSNQASFLESQSTTAYLAPFTANIYRYVRTELAVPFHPGLDHHPPLASEAGQTAGRTIGTYVTRLQSAIRDDTILDPIKTFLQAS